MNTWILFTFDRLLLGIIVGTALVVKKLAKTMEQETTKIQALLARE